MNYEPKANEPLEFPGDTIKVWLARLAVLPPFSGTVFLTKAVSAEEPLVIIGIAPVASAFFAMALTMLVGSLAMRGDQ